jgi:hypothetical protein
MNKFLTSLLCSGNVLSVAMENPLSALLEPAPALRGNRSIAALRVAPRGKAEVETLIIGPGPRRTASRKHFRGVQPALSPVSV